MKKVSYLLKRVDGDRSVTSASASVAVERGLTEAELDRIVAAGCSSNGSLGVGGNISSAAEWPPPPSRLN
jgi:hypothetical protein